MKNFNAKLALLFLLATPPVFSQQQYLKGVVQADSGEPIPFANILLSDGRGGETDLNGNYSITIPVGVDNLVLAVSCVGYVSDTLRWNRLENDLFLDCFLETGIELAAVEVRWTKALIESDALLSCGFGRIDYFGLPATPALGDKPCDPVVLPHEYSLEIFPNPFRSHFRLHLALPNPGTYYFNLLDAAGRSVFSAQQDLEVGFQALEFDLGEKEIPDGVYFLQVSDGRRNIPSRPLLKFSR